MKPVKTIKRSRRGNRDNNGISAEDELKENIIKAVVSWVLRKLLRVKQ